MAERTVPAPVEEKAPVSKETTRADDRYIVPPVDIYEDREGLTVVADLPGAQPSALDIRVDQGVLTIEARTSHQAPGDPIYREYQLVNFYRQFQLPDKVAVDQIGANLQNGVLRLKLPWAPTIRPRQIKVTAE